MSYNTIVRMAADTDLRQRFVAAAAQEDVTNPEVWVSQNFWDLVAFDTQAITDYQYAVETDNDEIGRYGKRSDVINDAKILSIVQANAPAE